MYTTVIDDEDYAIKPMNCPGGILVYKTKMRSYKDLPLRIGELGVVHRHELSGALHGLMRVRCFTQDDAHIFMTPEQIKEEIKGVVRLIDKVYSTFGFQYHIELSTMPEDHMGAIEDWNTATDALRDAIVELGYDYEVNEGDGAFYGPKLDFHPVSYTHLIARRPAGSLCQLSGSGTHGHGHIGPGIAIRHGEDIELVYRRLMLCDIIGARNHCISQVCSVNHDNTPR